MNFKDILKIDNDNLLFLDEFAEWINLDGIILKAVVDKQTAQKSGNTNLSRKGLFGDFTTLYFKTEDYCLKRERLPRHNERVKIFSNEWDCEKIFSVESCMSENGICTLTLSAYRQDTLRNKKNDLR